MLLEAYTFVHVLISLAGIFSGFIVLFGMFRAKPLPGWTAVFLITTVLTSVTGFFFPVHHILPSHIVGIISLVLLAIAIYALYARHLAGIWRKVYVVTAVLALYLNVFVGVVQSFLKIPTLKSLAPTQSEPPFKLTQLAVLILFVVLIIAAAVKFRGEPVQAEGTP